MLFQAHQSILELSAFLTHLGIKHRVFSEDYDIPDGEIIMSIFIIRVMRDEITRYKVFTSANKNYPQLLDYMTADQIAALGRDLSNFPVD